MIVGRRSVPVATLLFRALVGTEQRRDVQILDGAHMRDLQRTQKPQAAAPAAMTEWFASSARPTCELGGKECSQGVLVKGKAVGEQSVELRADAGTGWA